MQKQRNCGFLEIPDDELSESVDWPWAVNASRTTKPHRLLCPFSITDRPDLTEWVGDWFRWRALGVLPYGGHDLMEQPYFVLQAFEACEAAAADARELGLDKKAE